ncbi:MAG: GGDEF domain-containing phosphodiesterase [Lachnospiraceae bacterium]|nr:GGDEF domain-containing phosphodiesterase [Lachnospiraceae bacterium]
MTREKQELYLQYLREVSSGSGDMDKLKEALTGVAYYYHISAIEAEILGDDGRGIGQKEVMLFERENAAPVGEPVKYVFDPDGGSKIVIYVYADDKPFDETEKEELELFCSHACFVLELVRLRNFMDSAGTIQFSTNLFTVNGYYNRIAQMVSEGAKLSDYSSFCFNIKSFSDVNRRFGRAMGDSALTGYAKMLSKMMQPDEVLGHMGGDNFVALINKSRQKWFIERLEDIPVEIDVKGKKEKLHLGATIGIWEIDRDDINFDDIVGRAYLGVNQAKRVLHKNIAFVTENLVTRMNDLKAVLEYYEKALEDEEFRVYYQPKVDSRNGMLVGAEGLVRWFHEGKMISPGIFVPALEDNGKIIALDFYVLEHACRDIKEWTDKGYDPVPVSVNFSRMDLKDKQLAEKINKIIEDSGIDKKYIEVELTETVDEEEHGVLSGFIDKLYKMDIMTAVDDFGSGYSSLATLREFQIHTIKLDRSFVNTDDFSWKDEIILRDVIHMAGELSMDVLCEGVERDDQLALLNSVGCYVIQGYYYDRPLPKEDYEKRLIDKQYKK